MATDYVWYIFLYNLTACLCSYFLQGSGNLDAIQLIKKIGGSLTDSYLDEGTMQIVLTPDCFNPEFMYTFSFALLNDNI